jgi:hypothetical protein
MQLTEFEAVAHQSASEATDVYLTARQTRERYGRVSDMWIFRRLKDGSGFPKPHLIAARRFWKLSELVAWERARASAKAEA